MERQLNEQQYSRISDFPVVLSNRDIIYYKLNGEPYHDNSYSFILYEYIRGDKKKRKIMRGKWQNNQTIAFSLITDYNFIKGKEFCLELFIKLYNGKEVMDRVYIKIK